MNRRLTAFLLSSFTFFGGHFYNNRWVRAVFFGTLLLLWTFLDIPVNFLIVILFSHQIASIKSIIRVVWTIGVCLIWAASIIVSVIDAKNPLLPVEEKSAFFKYFSIIGLSSVGFLVIISIPSFLIYSNMHRFAGGLSPNRGKVVTSAPPFPINKRYLGSASISYGSAFDWRSEDVLAEGQGEITGRALVNGRPCAGLKLRLFLSNKLRSQWTITDNNGEYHIHVPPGKYLYQGWELDMQSADTVLSGKISIDNPEGHEKAITASKSSPQKGPDFYFADPIEIRQPTGEVSATNLVFQWAPYPNASYYTISIIDRGTGFSENNWTPLFDCGNEPKIDRPLISAAELGIKLQSGHKYTWSIQAYDKAGNFLSQTPDMFTTDGGFKIK